MANKPGPPKPFVWTVYRLAAKQTHLGVVEEADDEAAAIEKAAAEFKVPAN